MKILANEYLSLILSLNHLTFYLNEIMQQSIIRTVIVYFDNDTSTLASAIVKRIVDRHSAPYLMFNLDAPMRIVNTNDTLGGEIFNICIYKNIIDGRHRRLATVYYDARYINIYLSAESASDDVIAAFFQDIWRNSNLNVALIFWWKHIAIYTHFPYRKMFRVKLLEWNGEGDPVPLPKDIFKSILRSRNIHLNNSTLEIYIGSDPPKVQRFPGRFRIGPEYHFGGRDGYIAMLVERAMDGQWKYRTVLRRFGIIDFIYNRSGLIDDPTDIWGRPHNQIVSEKKNPKMKMYNVSSNVEQS